MILILLNSPEKEAVNTVTEGMDIFDDEPAPKQTTEEESSDDEDSIKVESITIDDFVAKNSINKIDFIKMDIEGSELPSLKGAINVLKKYKPKLAISIYHSLDDFVDIPLFLNSLNLGYKFYIKHGTIHHEETVLLAISR